MKAKGTVNDRCAAQQTPFMLGRNRPSIFRDNGRVQLLRHSVDLPPFAPVGTDQIFRCRPEAGGDNIGTGVDDPQIHHIKRFEQFVDACRHEEGIQRLSGRAARAEQELGDQIDGQTRLHVQHRIGSAESQPDSSNVTIIGGQEVHILVTSQTYLIICANGQYISNAHSIPGSIYTSAGLTITQSLMARFSMSFQSSCLPGQ